MKHATTTWNNRTGIPAALRCLAVWVATAFAGSPALAQGINPDYIQWMGRQGSRGGRDGEARAFAADDSRTWQEQLAAGNFTFDENGFAGGFIPTLADRSHLADPFFSGGSVRAAVPVPPRWDSREHGWITGIKRQNTARDNFGTCWAHAIMANIEAVLRIRNPSAYRDVSQPDLSENNLVLQSKYDALPLKGKTVYTSGGDIHQAVAYFSRWAGPIDEAEDPYPTPENHYKSLNSDVHGKAVGHVQEVIEYPPKTSDLGHEGIKRAVMEHGALWVTYFASPSIQVVENGQKFVLPLLAPDGKSFYNWFSRVVSGKKLPSNHAVALVGWDDGYPAENFACHGMPGDIPLPIPPGDGAYLIKNSWGTAVGDGGYFWISYYDSNMLRDPSYAIPRLERSDNYAGVYSHDPLGFVTTFPDPACSWGANVFTATEDAEISAIGFYPQSPGTEYSIFIRTGLDPNGDPASGRPANPEGQSGIAGHSGYATIPLDAPVPIAKGGKFAVILHLRSPKCLQPFATEADLRPRRNSWYSFSLTSGSSASPGESFISRDGIQWQDLTSVAPINLGKAEVFPSPDPDEEPIVDDLLYLPSRANLCIKAYVSAPAARGGMTLPVSAGGAETDPGKTQETHDSPTEPRGRGIWQNLGGDAFKKAKP